MTEQTITALFVLVGVIFTGVTGIVAAVMSSRQKAFEAIVGALREQVDGLREQVANNEVRIAKLESRDRAWSDYVHLLRRHITEQKSPPPPEWPAGLDR